MCLTHTQKLAHEWKIAHTLIYCPKIMLLHDVRLLICPLEMWVGNGPSETAQVQHLEYTTTIWTTCTGYIGRKLFMWEIICWAFTMDSDTILVMGLTHTQKLAHEWRITHTLIYCPKIMLLHDVELLIASTSSQIRRFHLQMQRISCRGSQSVICPSSMQ